MATATLEPPPTLDALARTDSNPSLTHSASSDEALPGVPSHSDALLTPTSGVTNLDNVETRPDLRTRTRSNSGSSPNLAAGSEPESSKPELRGKKSISRLRWTKSTQALRGKSKDKAAKEEKKSRPRSTSVSGASPPLPTREMPPPMPTRQAQPAPPAKSGGGFFSFLRKSKGKNAPSTSSQQQQPKKAEPPKPAPAGPSKAQMPAPAQKPEASPVTATAPVTIAPPIDTAAPSEAPKPKAEEASNPAPAKPQEITRPSHSRSQSVEAAPSESAAVFKPSSAPDVTPENMKSRMPYDETPSPSPDRVKRSPVMENLASNTATVSPSKNNVEHDEEVEEIESENEEDDDVVSPLPNGQPKLEPIKIPTKSAQSDGMTSAVSEATAADSEIIKTPSSTTSPARSPSKSPTRYDPVVDDKPAGNVGSVGLGRKESKWRKSFMGLGLADVSDIFGFLNLQSKPVKPSRSVRQSIREPPTSYDSYLNQQRRIASNRQSCAPTIHTRGTVAAETRHMSKQDEEVAETFFMA